MNINWNNIFIFVLGMIIGAWVWSRPLYIATPESCEQICVEQFEQWAA